MDSPLLTLMKENNWGPHAPLMDRLNAWVYWPLFLEKLKGLDHDALYDSHIHGLGHIERTMLHGAFCAMEEPLSERDTELLLECCSYHDVGRIDDSWDEEHGHRSAGQLAALTGRSGEELKMMQAAVDAHSRRDSHLMPTLERYGLAESERALTLALLLKDADGLDRVRIWDLDVRYLRRAASKRREYFAEYLYEHYQALISPSATPSFERSRLQKSSSHWARRRRREDY